MPSFTLYGIKFFFWSDEYSGGVLEPVHIHYTKGDPYQHAPRYWINHDGSICVDNKIPSDLKHSDQVRVEQVIQDNYARIIQMWHDQFPGEEIKFNDKVFKD